MRQDERLAFDLALHPARRVAYPAGEFVGQESFMRAREILSLGRLAGVRPGASVLDLCCGVAGPGRLLTRELGCDYLGVDSSASALAIARERAGDLPCRFERAELPPVPAGQHDVVLLLETMLAFEDKDVLLAGVASALRPGGRLAFTVEEGGRLTAAERALMPDADTVWPVPLGELLCVLERNGLRVRWWADHSRSQGAVAGALAAAYAADGHRISRLVGRRALDDLVAAHRLWSVWLGSGRVRKIAAVAEKAPVPALAGGDVRGRGQLERAARSRAACSAASRE